MSESESESIAANTANLPEGLKTVKNITICLNCDVIGCTKINEFSSQDSSPASPSNGVEFELLRWAVLADIVLRGAG